MNLKLDDPEYQTAHNALPLHRRLSASTTPGWHSWFSQRPHRLQWLLAFALLALAQVLFAGYELGVGNQTIQIPFLRHFQDPTLFANDPVVKTAADYPTYFFRLLAYVVPGGDVPAAYFYLHLLTTFAVLAAMAALTRAMFGDRLSGGIVVLILLAGHHRALAGDEFYSTGFTHTWAVFPLAIAAIMLLYREHVFAAFALAGIIFNLHALTAAYLLAMFVTWAAWETWQGRMRRATQARLIGLFVLLAIPTLLLMGAHLQSFGGEWVRLTRIRSADHSFPSSWWTTGTPDIPRFLLIVALGGLSLSFTSDPATRRKTLAIAAATAVLFLVGTVFSEMWPWPAVIRAQLFRASRLLLVIAFAHIARAIAQSLRLSVDPTLRRAVRPILLATALLVLAVLVMPTQITLLPWVVLIATVAALAAGRLSGAQAAMSAAALLVSVIAWRSIHFPIPGWDPATGHFGFASLVRSIGKLPVLSAAIAFAAVAGGLLWAFSWLKLGQILRGVCVATSVVALAVLTRFLYQHAGPGQIESDPWVRAQLWARENTPRDAVFLTPIQPGGFRIYSDRSVAAEWRDGTQAYFTAAFASDWWHRIEQVQQRIQYDTPGRNLLIKGRPLESDSDPELIALCRPRSEGGVGAAYIVLPNSSTTPKHNLIRIYRNAQYSIYLPQLAQAQAPEDTPDKNRWEAQEQFVRDVCLPNIDKYRKGDLRVSVVDENGQPVTDLPYRLNQTRHAFGFGCSLPFFKRPETQKIESFMPPQVDPRELSAFVQLFNYSQIGFSGKWGYIEPTEGKRDYTDLDLYLAFCRENHVTPEFHFLSGYEPLWLRRRPRAEQAARFLEHAKDMVKRYGDQIPYWQVVNEQMLLEYSPPVFEALRKLNPNIQLGISHCAQFWSRDPQKRDMYRGLPDLKWLKSKGVKVDYFAFHGHRPMGVWPDARDMYAALDTFANEGVRIHVSEFTVPQNMPITGPVRSGRWTDDLQAEYYERFYTVCFSHPDVDVINMWGIGPVTWQEGSGLLDDHYQPKPAFEVLKNLFWTRWHTESSGSLTPAGSLSLRAFYGDYELTLNLPDMRTARATFSLAAGQGGQIRLRLNRATGVLERT
ncbi:MAG TPA: endo-1,4-beta-xylanase [Tepidisphaeraceae bacterium]